MLFFNRKSTDLLPIRNIRTFTVLLLTTIVYANTFANEYRLKFLPVPTNILPSNDVRKLFQDTDGFIWLPTYNGLARYDGYSMLNFEITDEDKRVINTFINVVAEDHDKRLWIGTEKGLYLLDKTTGIIAPAKSDSLQEYNIADLMFDSEGNLWIGTNHGLFRKREGEEEFLKMVYDKSDPSISITSITEDGNKNLWIAGWEQGVFKYSIRSGKFHSFNDPVLNKAHVIFSDKEHNLWIGTWGEGLLKVTNSEGVYDTQGVLLYDQFRNEKGNSNSILDNIIYAIEQDEITGAIWIGSRSGLTILHNNEQGELFFENYVPGNDFGELPFNEVNSILKTRDHTLWIGMLGGGVCKAITGDDNIKSNDLNKLRELYQSSSVKSLLHDDEGIFWMGIAGFGMIKYNPIDGSFMNYKEVPALKDLPYTSLVNLIIQREETGEICFGTWNDGVWIYDKGTNKLKTINQESHPKFIDDCVIVLYEDSRKNLWIGSRNGVYIYDKDEQFFTLNEWLEQETGLHASQVSDVKEDQHGMIWISTNYHGITRVDPVGKEIKQYADGAGLHCNNIYTLHVDSCNRVWAGTIGNGLYYFNREKDHFFQTTSIPNIEKRSITNIIEDLNGRIWITTHDAAITFLVNERYEFEEIIYFSDPYSPHEFNFNKKAAVSIADGSLIFGGSRGIRIINTNDILYAESSLPLVFTDLKINGVSVRQGSLPSLDSDINYTDRIILSHRENNIQIDFSLLNFSNTRENIYTYILEEYDQEPVVTGARNHSAIYTNLPPGKYIFRLRGAPEYGEWVRDERVLHVEVLPAPWLSRWAFAAYILLAISILYLSWWFTRYRLKLNYKLHLAEVEKQKSEEVNHAKLQFFTNITHELMTPLTIISASLENLKKKEVNPLHGLISIQTTRLMRLIQQVLEFKKVESSNVKLMVSRSNITIFVKSCVDAFLPLVKKKNLVTSFSSHPGEIEGYFDPDKVDKIIYNLLSNATKYTPTGGEISISLSLKGDDWLELAVVNKGEPIGEERVNQLFQRFYESDHAKFNTIGSGIGLSLVKDLATIHRGSISVTSNDEEGNCFLVSLPIGEENYHAGEIDTITPGVPDCFVPTVDGDTQAEKQKEPPISNFTLLIVEDNEQLALLISNLFSYYYNVKTATNGLEAISILEKSDIDLIVSDIMMPEMDGVELCKYVKEKFELCHIPVILLTAKSGEGDEIEGYASGADGYVTKPFNFELLYAQVNNQLKKLERRKSELRKQLVFEVEALEYTSLDEQFLTEAINCITANMEDPTFDLERFSEIMGHSKTTLTEKLKKLTGFTPVAFIRDVKLVTAYRMIEENQEIRIDDLAYSIGFNDPKYFSTCFKKKYGISPTKMMKDLTLKSQHTW